MIKANELRIGNWVNWTKPEDKPTYEKVYELYEDIINEDKEEFYDPIPMNPEIFKAIKFDWSGGDHYASNDNKIWVEDNNGFYRLCRPVFSPTKIKYLHQLQNLYFALTNEELQIQELNRESVEKGIKF